MDARPPRTSIATFASLFDHLRRLDVAPGEMAEAGLVARAAQAPREGGLPTRAFIDVLERCAERLSDSLFGLRYGQGLDPQSLGPPGLFWRHAPTFRYSLGVTSRFLHLHHEGVTVSLAMEGSIAWIAQRADPDLRRGARQWIEANVSFGLSAGRWILGESWKPLRVTFSHEPGRDPSLYEGVLRARVAFGADEDGLMVAAADLDRPAVDRSPLRLHLAERALLTRANVEPPTLRRQTERAIDDLLRSKRPRLGAAAQAVGMSARSLQRKLQGESTSFGALLAERRMRIVERERLRTTPATLSVLADRTSFSDSTAISRFLRSHRRTGPPHER